MASRLIEIFKDNNLVTKIQKRLPYLFQLAELESSRAGKTGMEVGSAREKILIALLIYKFGENNVYTEIPITQPGVDVKLFGEPISIKTKTGKYLGGVKLVWTVDTESSRLFRDNYYPNFDILFAQINWNNYGYLYYIPKEIQTYLYDEIGKDKYIKLPVPGTNPRGVEITSQALSLLVENSETKYIEINWVKQLIKFDQYKRWVDLWQEE